MLSRRSLCALALSAVALLSPAGFAAAQDGPKIATVNPAKVFNEMQETKDLKQNKQAPAVSATQMTDSKMDKVAASTFSGANDNGRLGSGIDGVSR